MTTARSMPEKKPGDTWILSVIATVLLAAVGSGLMVWLSMPRSPASPPIDGTSFHASIDRPVPEFKLVDQEGKEVSLDDLKGQIWVASFIFTRCHSTCPMVSSTMAQLRDELPDDVRLVSFSVDPRHDTPEILATYAKSFGADPAKWSFLTGDKDQIYRISKDGFMLAVEENTDPRANAGDLVVHSNRMVLVDADGIARTTYNCLDPSSVEMMKRAVAKLEEKDS